MSRRKRTHRTKYHRIKQFTITKIFSFTRSSHYANMLRVSCYCLHSTDEKVCVCERATVCKTFPVLATATVDVLCYAFKINDRNTWTHLINRFFEMVNKGIHDARGNACTRIIQDFTFLFLYFSLFLSLILSFCPSPSLSCLRSFFHSHFTENALSKTIVQFFDKSLKLSQHTINVHVML